MNHKINLNYFIFEKMNEHDPFLLGKWIAEFWSEKE